jgi:hypothetical protein
MPAPMTKGGGSGRYGIAVIRLAKTEVILQDTDTSDRFAFPLVPRSPKAPKSKTMPHLSTLLNTGVAALVINPTREGKEARSPIVYAGEFAYSMNAKGDILYGISPSHDSHLCQFAGYARPNNDPKAEPVWEAKRSTFDPSRIQQEFSALFKTSDNDETPGLEVRWGYWRYKFSPTQNENGQTIMGVELLNPKSGAALKAQYELLRLAGIIGKDKSTGENTVLIDIPGELENYLPAVERIELKALAGMEFILAFETYEGEDGKSRVRINSLAKQPGRAEKQRTPLMPASSDITDEDLKQINRGLKSKPKPKAAKKAAQGSKVKTSKSPKRGTKGRTDDDAYDPF